MLDLDETLVHCNVHNDEISSQIEPVEVEIEEEDWDMKLPVINKTGRINQIKVNIRPYAKEFLERMSQFFEIVIFTASSQSYANTVLNVLDPNNKFITLRLYRQQCIPAFGHGQ